MTDEHQSRHLRLSLRSAMSESEILNHISPIRLHRKIQASLSRCHKVPPPPPPIKKSVNQNPLRTAVSLHKIAFAVAPTGTQITSNTMVCMFNPSTTVFLQG